MIYYSALGSWLRHWNVRQLKFFFFPWSAETITIHSSEEFSPLLKHAGLCCKYAMTHARTHDPPAKEVAGGIPECPNAFLFLLTEWNYEAAQRWHDRLWSMPPTRTHILCFYVWYSKCVQPWFQSHHEIFQMSQFLQPSHTGPTNNIFLGLHQAFQLVPFPPHVRTTLTTSYSRVQIDQTTPVGAPSQSRLCCTSVYFCPWVWE